MAWSQAHATPSVTDSVVESTITIGVFTINISGIGSGKTYYFRAFATNRAGTGYGDVVTLTTSNDSVRFTYNGQSVTYGVIVSPTTGKKWLDRNLGAKQAATAFNDYLAYGDLFQWGRPADGHQLINWTSSNAGSPVNSGTTTTKATSDNPGHSNFILVPDPYDSTGDWRSENNNNRWNTIPQGPCPEGWHVPTRLEWAAEISTISSNGYHSGGTATAGGIKDYTTAYSLLKLSCPGYHSGAGDGDGPGTMNHPGERGMYWTSRTQKMIGGSYYGNMIGFDINAAGAGDVECAAMVTGLSIRCIKDY
jgi:uncharacterized protein (TIGR02145 family)